MLLDRTGKMASLNGRGSCLSGDSESTNDNVAFRAKVILNNYN